MAWVRSAALRGVRQTIEELGGDADAVARRAGAPLGVLDDDELLVRDTAVAVILETAARQLDCPDLGLRVALKQDLSMLGPLAVAMQNSATVAEALECASRYMFVHDRNLRVALGPDPHGDRAVVAVQYGYPPGVQVPPQSVEMGLLFLHRVLGFLLGGPYGLRTAELPHRAVASRARYEELFGAQVNFAQPQAVLRVAGDLPGRPVPGGDRLTRRVALAYLEAQASDTGRSIPRRVRTVVQQSLGTGPGSLAFAARTLGMSSRSLQRHLAAAGTTFAAILDDVRRERAASLLTESDLPLTQVARNVGLSEGATLSRYARRWWGTTARSVRNDGLPVAAPASAAADRSGHRPAPGRVRSDSS
jgi:AraC-like DNA-binding protein